MGGWGKGEGVWEGGVRVRVCGRVWGRGVRRVCERMG